MRKKYFSNRTKNSRQVSAGLIIVVVAAAGTMLLLGSHASSPYASITADKGTLTNGATVQTCSGASDNNTCVVFGSASSGGGGGTGGGGSNMIVGLDAGNWNTTGAANMAGAVKLVRLDTILGEPISDYSSNGIKVDVSFAGDLTNSDSYNTGGVGAINAANWASDALAWYQANCTTAECPMIEILNEPGGTWYWGGNAMSQANATGYANILKATYTAFHNAYPSGAPLVLASYDGGQNDNNLAWGQEVWNQSANGGINVNNYVDGVTDHPYGGTPNDTVNAANLAQSAAGNRADVTATYSQTGKPVYITEVGWSTYTAGASAVYDSALRGVSYQWPGADSAANAYHGLDQCDNLYNFMSWARGTGYVNTVTYFNYADYNSGDNYFGILNFLNDPIGANGTNKPAYTALKNAAANLPNPCPSAANGYTLQAN